MTVVHELKTDPEPFASSLCGDKLYEIRLDDRGFLLGDMLVLRETKYNGAEMAAGAPLEYTGRVLYRWVTEVRSGYGLKDGWVILGVRTSDTRVDDSTEPGWNEIMNYGGCPNETDSHRTD